MKNFQQISACIQLILLCCLLPFTGGCRIQDSTEQNYFGILTKTEKISVSLMVPIIVSVDGREEHRLEKFSLIDFPVKWNSSVFHATDYELGSRGPITTIHGNVSADGQWIDSLVFVRFSIIDYKPIYDFRITLVGIPLGTEVKGHLTQLGSFSQTGDVRKFVRDFVYNPADNATLVRTDWENTTFPPVLKVDFGVFSQ